MGRNTDYYTACHKSFRLDLLSTTVLLQCRIFGGFFADGTTYPCSAHQNLAFNKHSDNKHSSNFGV